MKKDSGLYKKIKIYCFFQEKVFLCLLKSSYVYKAPKRVFIFAQETTMFS